MSPRYLTCIKVSIHSFPRCPVVAFRHILSNPDTRLLSPRSVPYAYKFDSDVSKWDVGKVSTMNYSKYSFLPPLSRRRRFIPPYSVLSNPDTRLLSRLLQCF